MIYKQVKRWGGRFFKKCLNQAENFCAFFLARIFAKKTGLCVAAVERLPALHYSVDFIFLSFGIMGFNFLFHIL